MINIRQRHTRKLGKKGFTLVEVVLAATITSLLLFTIYGVFSSVSDVRDEIEGNREIYHRSRIIFDHIGRELRGAFYDSKNHFSIFESGFDNGLPYIEFSTTTLTGLQAAEDAGVVRYELREEPEKGYALYRQTRALYADSDMGSDAIRLSGGISSLGWKFYYQGSWSDVWDDISASEGLPALVQLNMEMAGEKGDIAFQSAFDLSRGDKE